MTKDSQATDVPTDGSEDQTANAGGEFAQEGPVAAEDPLAPLLHTLGSHLDRLLGKSDRLRAACKPLQRWSKPGALTDFARLEKDFGLWQQEFGEQLEGEFGLGEVLKAVQQHLGTGKARMRKELGRQLKEATGQAGLRLKVVSREDPVELRIPPLAVRLDLEGGKAQLLFAKQVIETCSPTAAEIIRCHQNTTKRLNGSWDAEEFFERCLVAYRMGLAATGGKWGDRLELIDFLGQLAIRMQGKAFAVDPVSTNFKGYSRGQFAFDVHRLRQARGLQQNGKRLNFGVATGTAATQKKRVIYLEDDLGQGEYKLNIYFTEVS